MNITMAGHPFVDGSGKGTNLLKCHGPACVRARPLTGVDENQAQGVATAMGAMNANPEQRFIGGKWDGARCSTGPVSGARRAASVQARDSKN